MAHLGLVDMLTRTSLRIYVATALAAVAMPFIVRYAPSSPPGQPPYPLVRICVVAMAPAFYLTYAVLPYKYSNMCCLDDPDPIGRARVLWFVVTAMNGLFWTALSAIVVFVIRIVRRRRIPAGI